MARKTPSIRTQKPLATAEAVLAARRTRFNPLRSLTAQTLTTALDNYLGGDIRAAVMLWEVIAERDDTIPAVKLKRETDVSLRECQVIALEKSPEAERHQDVLQRFWRSVKVTDAYNRNVKGGRGRLIKQMMEAVSFGYSVHHVVWSVRGGELRAEFERVPLQFFENTTGTLRYVADGMGMVGEDLDEVNWLVHTGPALMTAASIAYFFKRLSLQDWMAFSEKFAMPGVLGKTSAAKGSPQGEAMKAAVESFGNDWSGVVYGDDGSAKIELVQANGNPAAMPMPALIERADRKIAALYRGADLSTMSAGSGQGQGASLQGEEKDVLLADDCATISEALRAIDRIVIAWHFGTDVDPLAEITVMPPVTDDKKFLLDAAGALADRGAKVSEQAVMSRLGIEATDESDPLDRPLGKTGKPESIANSQSPIAMPDMAGNAYNPSQKRADDGKWVSPAGPRVAGEDGADKGGATLESGVYRGEDAPPAVKSYEAKPNGQVMVELSNGSKVAVDVDPAGMDDDAALRRELARQAKRIWAKEKKAKQDIAGNAAPEGAGGNDLVAAAAQLLAEARVAALAPEAEALRKILAMTDEDEMRAAAKEWSLNLPDGLERTGKLDAAWEKVMAAAFGEGLE